MSTNVQKASDHVGRGIVNDTRRRRGWKAGTRGLSVAGFWLLMWKVGWTLQVLGNLRQTAMGLMIFVTGKAPTNQGASLQEGTRGAGPWKRARPVNQGDRWAEEWRS